MAGIMNTRFARFVKIILDIVYGGLIFGCAALVLWIAFFPIIMSQREFIGTASIPVLIGSGEEPEFEVTFTSASKDLIRAAFVNEAEGILRLETNSFWMILVANAAKLVVGIGLTYIFYLLRCILQSTMDGSPFSSENCQHVRRLGYAVLVLGFVQPSVQNIAAAEILNQLQTTSPILNPGPGFNVEVILISLLILLLAYIWSYGLALEEDKALTV